VTLQIALVLAVLLAAMSLFAWGKLAVDLVALSVMTLPRRPDPRREPQSAPDAPVLRLHVRRRVYAHWQLDEHSGQLAGRGTRATAALVIQAGDILRLRADAAQIASLQEREGITIRPRARWSIRQLEEGPTKQLEVILAPSSRLAGRTLREPRFAAVYGAMVLAIRHRGTVMHRGLENTRLQ